MVNKTIFIMSILVFTFLFGTGYNAETGAYSICQAQAETGVSVGKEMPTFTANNLNGENVQVGGTGVPYVLNFWATWCPPCKAELPELNEFANAHTEDVQFYAINIEESENTITDFLQNTGYSLPILLDADGSISQEFRVRAVPTTIVVDSQGVIRYRKTGGVTKEELENVLSTL
ncbi:thiol:disulfide oxidoreductases, DsbE subfamily protein [Propionispira arboris]|uniref:Thiol:disulfide oxidoreductases, DsbE subfamily protein n=1 Tax=Propionispira arboris TaxID=84035 RepID=A0A1H7BUZ0_9FIRM|nr:TlpA disulfide reductase family protein [Propionispira arboris]SEJ80137.1 thiol:disulfide oxidoreductases, DsbE subfamily protein [Propionispira arboris]